MNRLTPTQAVALCRYAKAACPQQAFDEYTPDAWADLLADLRYEDCLQGLRQVVMSQPFVAPAEIRAEVKRIRSRRIQEFGVIPAPPEDLPESQWIDWHRNVVRRIGDGEVTHPAQIESACVDTGRRLTEAELANLLPSIPEADA